ncbi:class I SAM-dependent methyltransferase [Alkalihalobacillus sp. LMS39]|uniref:class I SAM-dependent methyltransferase n=1 Tax=Alkalihalobacillus sp. LMS39 TaxID=2924032 RepID=UPI001FB51FDB|nr:class I SAM-dependent methyltransferase [Alkalihalobacillus sp. LMS39]UOE92139.1 class I SAM-dependent methyltransferase [Alkalihalobacillus sp. LMS39]
MSVWYEEHFQTDYLMIYKHRHENASSELEKLLPFISINENMTVLDLCCGYGRHSRYLAQRGWRVTGVDLSTPLLQEAITLSLNEPIQYMRCDMRNLPFHTEMDLVVNMFTSFGYFKTDEDNEKVIQGVNRALVPGGYFIFDYLNSAYIQSNLNPFSKESIGKTEIIQHRKIINGFVHKSILISDENEKRRYEEMIKLYDVHELMKMLQQNGFAIEATFGNYDAKPFDIQSSPRLIFICKKETSR